jgi:uncharacterized protein
VDRASPHLPYAAPIEFFRNGGFRFGGMSHRGALLCVPDGMWASSVHSTADIDVAALDLVFSTVPPVQMCIIGAGADPWLVPPDLRARAREVGFSMEGMTTVAAVHTYNLLVEEGRRVAALMIPLA